MARHLRNFGRFSGRFRQGVALRSGRAKKKIVCDVLARQAVRPGCRSACNQGLWLKAYCHWDQTSDHRRRLFSNIKYTTQST